MQRVLLHQGRQMVRPPRDVNYTALQSQKAVSAYLKSKQILPFGFANGATTSGRKLYRRAKPKMQYLLTFQVSRYCLFGFARRYYYSRISLHKRRRWPDVSSVLRHHGTHTVGSLSAVMAERNAFRDAEGTTDPPWNRFSLDTVFSTIV